MTATKNQEARLHEKAGAAYGTLNADPARAVALSKRGRTVADLRWDHESGRQADIAHAIELTSRVDAGLEPSSPFDVAEQLTTAEAVVAFLAEAEATADPAYIEHARALAARARAMHGIE